MVKGQPLTRRPESFSAAAAVAAAAESEPTKKSGSGGGPTIRAGLGQWAVSPVNLQFLSRAGVFYVAASIWMDCRAALKSKLTTYISSRAIDPPRPQFNQWQADHLAAAFGSAY